MVKDGTWRRMVQVTCISTLPMVTRCGSFLGGRIPPLQVTDLQIQLLQISPNTARNL